MKNGAERKPWNVEEAAAVLGVSPHTVRAWLRQRRLPYLKLGRRVLLDPEAVERFKEKNTVAEVEL
jgi:excisionase family DNA binding protein